MASLYNLRNTYKMAGRGGGLFGNFDDDEATVRAMLQMEQGVNVDQEMRELAVLGANVGRGFRNGGPLIKKLTALGLTGAAMRSAFNYATSHGHGGPKEKLQTKGKRYEKEDRDPTQRKYFRTEREQVNAALGWKEWSDNIVAEERKKIKGQLIICHEVDRGQDLEKGFGMVAC